MSPGGPVSVESKLGTIGNQNCNWGSRFAFQKGRSGFWLVTRLEMDKFGRGGGVKVEAVGLFD